MKFKPIYTNRELAKMFGIDHRLMLHKLKELHVPYDKKGRIWLRDLPIEIVESMERAAVLNAGF